MVPADLAAVETLVQRCFDTGLPPAIDRHLVLREGKVLKAYAAGRRIGLPGGQQALLLGMVCVDPEARGRGWGLPEDPGPPLFGDPVFLGTDL